MASHTIALVNLGKCEIRIWVVVVLVAVAYFSVNIIYRCETKNLAKSNMRTFRFFASLEAQSSQVISVFLLHHLVS